MAWKIGVALKFDWCIDRAVAKWVAKYQSNTKYEKYHVLSRDFEIIEML